MQKGLFVSAGLTVSQRLGFLKLATMASSSLRASRRRSEVKDSKRVAKPMTPSMRLRKALASGEDGFLVKSCSLVKKSGEPMYSMREFTSSARPDAKAETLRELMRRV